MDQQIETDQKVIEELKKKVIDQMGQITELEMWCDANIDLLMQRIDRTKLLSRKRERLKREIMVFDKVKAKINLIRSQHEK